MSRLTGDTRFEKAAHKAFFALWNRRSDIGLVGNTINAWNGVRALSFEIVVFYKMTGLRIGFIQKSARLVLASTPFLNMLSSGTS